MSAFFEKILRESKIAFGFFDQDYILKDNSNLLAQYTGGRLQKKSAVLWDIFPELVGSEDKIHDLLFKSIKKFEFEKLTRLTDENKLRYFTLSLFPYRDDSLSSQHLLCIVTDTTAATSLEQQVQQQKNEIRLLHANIATLQNRYGEEIYGKSEKIQAVKDFIDKIAKIRNTTILLYGESGTGKNLVAYAIHKKSMQEESPFVEINCASIPDTLIESEIFGYEKGAFTNAFSSKKGLLEEANGGTLFLDEIGELPLPLQAKFLSFLETKRFRRLGSTQEHTVQVRIIAATNRDLKKAVEAKEFRQDLFYRLNVVSNELPPLRELGEDVIILANYYLNYFSFDFGKKIIGLSRDAEAKLLNYAWPGNVRELRNVIERAVIFAENNMITQDDLLLYNAIDAKKVRVINDTFSLPTGGLSLYELEKKLLLQALERSDGNQTKAAKLLGLSLDTFRYRLKKYNL
ncbi:sigma 54-interacting transcriptional regulator [candidate division KSB1 bacterium]|nr:sigma 54-interacting transcriptional regulator [candidate division KSB1 bacterium]